MVRLQLKSLRGEINADSGLTSGHCSGDSLYLCSHRHHLSDICPYLCIKSHFTLGLMGD